jgi:uncharacterized protein (DUF111 family)
MEKKSQLIVTHVDHLAGEVLGFALERLMALGANNVQLCPTLTKKNRPGHILVIDSGADREEALARFLVTELKITGYHRIDTTHVFHETSFQKKQVIIRTGAGTASLECEIKVFGDPEKPLTVCVEHDCLVRLQQRLLDKCNIQMSLMDLRGRIESRALQSAGEIDLEI